MIYNRKKKAGLTWMLTAVFMVTMVLGPLGTAPAAADSIGGLIAQMEELHRYADDYNRDHLGAARTAVQGLDQVDVALLINPQVISKFADEDEAREKISQLFQDGAGIYYAPDSDGIRDLVNNFADRNQPTCKALLGEELSFQDIFHWLHDSRALLPQMPPANQAARMATDSRSELIDKTNSFLGQAMDQALDQSRNVPLRDTLQSLGWNGSMLLGQKSALSTQIPANTRLLAEYALALLAIRSETGIQTAGVPGFTAYDPYTDRYDENGRRIEGQARLTDSALNKNLPFKIKIMNQDATPLLAWHSDDPSVVEVREDAQTENFVLTARKTGTARITAYRDYSENGHVSDPQQDWLYIFDISIEDPATARVSDIDQLQAALADSRVKTIILQDDITPAVTINRLVDLDLAGHTLGGDVTIDSSASGSMTISGNGTIGGDLTINTPSASIDSDAAVTGLTVIEAVSSQTFASTGTHSQGISLEGPGRLHLSGDAGASTVEVNTSEPVILAGSISGDVTIKAAGATVRIDEGTEIDTIIVEPSAAGSRIELTAGAALNNLEADADITLALEEGATVGAVSGSGEVTQVLLYRVTFDKNTGDTEAVPSYMLVDAGQALQELPQPPVKARHTFTGWNEKADGSGNEFTTATPVEASLTVYAQWSRISVPGGGGAATPRIPGELVSILGGIIKKLDVVVEVSREAFHTGFRLLIERVTAIEELLPPAGQRLVSPVFSISKDVEGPFLVPVTITLPFDREQVDQERDRLKLCWYDPDMKAWQELEQQVVDWEKAAISGSIDHLSRFAVIAIRDVDVIEPPFPDIIGHWAQDYITELVQREAISGYPDGTFQPNRTISRAEFATVLVKAMQLPPAPGAAFADTAGHWGEDYIATAFARGIIQGHSPERFAPDDRITREQMAAMLARALELTPGEAETAFIDRDLIAPWAQGYIQAAVDAGIITGFPDGSFGPRNWSSRAEAAAMIIRALPGER